MIPTLLLAAALTLPPNTPTLVLRNGDRIDVQGGVKEEKGIVLFHATGGALYSLPLIEIDVEATRAAAAPPTIVHPESHAKLKVSPEERERLLRELEKNHSGTPAPLEQQTIRLPPPPTSEEQTQAKSEEWSWRNRARGLREGIRQAQENRDLLVQKADALRGHIAGLISLGYKPSQFTYDTSQLQYTLEQIPYADLEVTRAQRAYEQFREDARRQGVLPGWIDN